MKAEMLNSLFQPSLDWSIPTTIVYVGLGVIGASLLIHTVILLTRYIGKWQRREDRYAQILNRFEITCGERVCLDHCSADLGIKDKARMLTDWKEFERVMEWAEKQPARRVAVMKIRRKLEDRAWRPPTIRQRERSIRRSPPVARVT